MNLKIKINLSDKIIGKYTDGNETVYVSGRVIGNEVFIETADSNGLREPLSASLTTYHDGMKTVNRKRAISPIEAVQEMLGFKTYNDFI